MKTNKTGIVVFLIIAAFAIWALSKMQTSETNVPFFAGGEEKVVYTLDVSCSTDSICQQEMIKAGASPDIQVKCIESKCVYETRDILPEGPQ
jgi:hypothetical protein